MSKKKIIALSGEASKALHWFALENCDEVKDYLSQYKAIHPHTDEKAKFLSWFSDKVYHVLHDTQSSDYDLVVDIGDAGETSYLPMQASLDVVDESNDDPIPEDENFIDDDEEDGDMYPSEDELIVDTDDSDDDDDIDACYSSDDSD
ncbi:hypothetical protein L1887_32654 [Cichorium endivia]|nr:hypothetical protein L1887_32654 [Cichorium endivia]